MERPWVWKFVSLRSWCYARWCCLGDNRWAIKTIALDINKCNISISKDLLYRVIRRKRISIDSLRTKAIRVNELWSRPSTRNVLFFSSYKNTAFDIRENDCRQWLDEWIYFPTSLISGFSEFQDQESYNIQFVGLDISCEKRTIATWPSDDFE